MLLEREFTKEEVIQVLSKIEGDKAPSPDGFTMAFCTNAGVLWKKMSWFERSMNASFLTLVPKKCNALNIKDFQLSVWWIVCISCYSRCWLIN